MTVQELIDALNKVEDKSLPVYHFTGFDITRVEECWGRIKEVTLF